MEVETNHSIEFLNAKIIQEGTKINSTMYRKFTANKNIISYKGNTPLPYTIGALNTYINRALHGCSTEKSLKE